jgi:hypothetical protein
MIRLLIAIVILVGGVFFLQRAESFLPIPSSLSVPVFTGLVVLAWLTFQYGVWAEYWSAMMKARGVVEKSQEATREIKKATTTVTDNIEKISTAISSQPGSADVTLQAFRELGNIVDAFGRTLVTYNETQDHFYEALTKHLDTLTPFVPKSYRAAIHRPDSAFIMMWMDATHPELEDVRDAVTETFREFGISAFRADDIEHEGVITQRIHDEIKTSEFLFADLTGNRPNVYYEVGYAHAAGKEVILFRKRGTTVSFDLAGYNCPEYENLRDLKQKLARHLEKKTNKKPPNH